MSMLMGLLGGGVPDLNVTLVNGAPNASAFESANAVAGYRLGNDKKVYYGATRMAGPWGVASTTEYSQFGEWCAPAGTASDYEVRATVEDGTLSSGTTGAWLNLGTTQTWEVTDTNVDGSPMTCTMNIEIRKASNQRRVALATVLFTAQKYG